MRKILSVVFLLSALTPMLAAQTAVTVNEDATSFTMANGIVTVKVSKRSGDLTSLVYKGIETMESNSGHAGGYWSHDAFSPEQIHRITIDPKTNGGERAEVSVKGISNGRRLGRPAGLAAGAEGDFPVDIEIRYSLGRGESGTYTYCILDHKPEYPAGSIGEARYCAKIAHTFDWMSIDEKRNKYYPEELPGEDKYVYTAVQSENLAYGWSSTKDKIGWWIVNPTIEYLSGGPTKVEFLCHRDTTQVQAPCVLNYWRSSHYGGAVLPVAAGESYTKVVGPFMIYVNSGEDPMSIWKDARTQAEKENKKWPYSWVNGVDYPHREERSTVSGQFILNDPLMPGGAKFIGKITVGLTGAPYMMTPLPPAPPSTNPVNLPPGRVGRAGRAGRGPASGPAGELAAAPATSPAGQLAGGGGGRRGRGPATGPVAAAPAVPPQPRQITWQTDAKHYQQWASSDSKDGRFVFPTIRPGKYTLYAYADGILGDFAKADIVIPAGGKPVDLGKIDWTPVRRGKQVFEIGIPNRTATEFAGGDKYFEPDAQLQYPKLFPDDVNFTVGKSDISKDWYFEHIPHNIDPNARIAPFSGIQSQPGNPTPFRINFELPEAPKGKATLRLAFCTASTRAVEVSINDHAAGAVDRLPGGDSTVTRHGIQGIWFERELVFDASMMKKGANMLTLTVPGGSLNNGVIYDCVRLELDEAATPPAAPAAVQ